MGHSGSEQPHSGKSLEWLCISLDNALENHTHLMSSGLFRKCAVKCELTQSQSVNHDFPTIISDEGARHTIKRELHGGGWQLHQIWLLPRVPTMVSFKQVHLITFYYRSLGVYVYIYIWTWCKYNLADKRSLAWLSLAKKCSILHEKTKHKQQSVN